MKTWRVPAGTLGVPMPKRAAHEGDGPKRPGGLPPVAYRSPYARWGEANATAGEPFASRGCRMEVVAERHAKDGDPKGKAPRYYGRRSFP